MPQTLINSTWVCIILTFDSSISGRQIPERSHAVVEGNNHNVPMSGKNLPIIHRERRSAGSEATAEDP